MVDNLDVHSTASSDISESLRAQILGTRYTRRKSTKENSELLRDYIVVPSKGSHLEIINQSDNGKLPTSDQRSQGSDKKSQTSEKKSETSEKRSQTSEKRSQTSDKKSQTSDNEKLRPDSSAKSASYHTVPGSQNSPSKNDFVVVSTPEKRDSFVVIPSNPDSRTSMKSTNEPRYTTIQTQTVAIQTVATGTDADYECRCSWDDQECVCPECQPQDCRYGYSKKRGPPPAPEESSDPSTFENFTESSSQTIDIKRRYKNHCTCNCRAWNDYDSSITGQLSDSDESYTDFLDLPYQNNEEYLKLLRELEKKLIARNRERVRRTMMEFEKKSRQNQNLEKPVYDYSDDNASMLRKLAGKPKNRKNVCCKCGRNKRVNSDILQNEKNWEELNFVQSVVQDPGSYSQSQNRIERSMHKSHWQLDPRSGEWVKVSSFQQTDFSRPPRGDYSQDDSLMGCKKECCCRQKKRR